MSPIEGGKRYSAQAELTFLLRVTEGCIRKSAHQLITGTVTDADLQLLVSDMERMMRILKGYLDAKNPAGGSQ
ncbi:hypothetical protein [Saccharopolyspora phatthalungensis]|uniref:Four helix bundle protein n=1 Tax=Saccharopolyspora phatthalungensis TaxID=664693 RepID=A0A840QFY0_9PSEU|nr:hypothetical protein [Saccharopolyspora phatthalungensis]MBB5158850.1 hypothetical protein [Saccharopolyspora phatthalungensis]